MTDRNRPVEARVPLRCIAAGRARPSRAGIRRTRELECRVICQAREARDSFVNQGQGRAASRQAPSVCRGDLSWSRRGAQDIFLFSFVPRGHDWTLPLPSPHSTALPCPSGRFISSKRRSHDRVAGAENGLKGRTRRPSRPGFAICDAQGRSRPSRLAVLHRTGYHAVVPESDGSLTAQVPSLGEENARWWVHNEHWRWGFGWQRLPSILL